MSMLRPAVNQLISPDSSIYELTEGVAKRAREIVDEEIKLRKSGVDDDDIPTTNPVEMAVDEFYNGKYKIVPDNDYEVPLYDKTKTENGNPREDPAKRLENE